MKIQKICGAVMVLCGMAALMLSGDLTIGILFIVIGFAALTSRKKVLI